MISQANISILLLLFVIVALLLFIWYLVKNNNNLGLPVEHFNSALTQISELKVENHALKMQIDELKNNSSTLALQEYALFPKSRNPPINHIDPKFIENIDNLLVEYSSGNLLLVLRETKKYLSKNSNEFWELASIEYRWNSIQDYKMKGISDFQALIIQENRLSESTLSLIRKIEKFATNNALNANPPQSPPA